MMTPALKPVGKYCVFDPDILREPYSADPSGVVLLRQNSRRARDTNTRPRASWLKICRASF
jgi:hypothetical protein